MRPLRYSINITLDGCCDHRAADTNEELHRHAAAGIAQADALVLGRVTYEMMEAAFREPGRTGTKPDWMEDWMMPFAHTIHAAKKYVVAGSLESVDWNAELVRGDLALAIQQLKSQPGKGLVTGGVTLPLALAKLGLIDEYEFIGASRELRGTVRACWRGFRSMWIWNRLRGKSSVVEHLRCGIG